MRAQFAVAPVGDSFEVQLIDEQGHVLMASGVGTREHAQHVMTQVGEAVGRIMEPRRLGQKS